MKRLLPLLLALVLVITAIVPAYATGDGNLDGLRGIQWAARAGDTAQKELALFGFDRSRLRLYRVYPRTI